MRMGCVVAAALAASGPALADYGVKPIWDDFQPAVSTQYRPPDGGKRYPPPDTKSLIRASDRQFRDTPREDRRFPDARKPGSGAGQPIPPAGQTIPPVRPGGDVESKPPSQVGR